MATGYFIGIGDKTTCGGKVQDGDHRVMMYGIAHARMGDRVSCGKDGKLYSIVGGISNMVSHGRHLAGTLDSFSGCPCKASLIPSVYTATYNKEVSPVARAARALAQPTNYSEGSATTKSQLVASGSVATQPEPGICSHPDQMEELASYIAGEMNRNIHDSSVLKMKELLSYDVAEETRKQIDLPWYAKIGATSPQVIGAAKGAAAMALWTERVGQGRLWDHKPILAKKYNGAVYHKQGDYDYFYDIWSNIHYGYVGRVGGLSESVLLDGAGAEQIISDSKRKLEEMASIPKEQQKLEGPHRSADIDGLRAWDDAPDRISISIGIKLFSRHPDGGITVKMIMDEVLAVTPEQWGEGVHVHKCKKN